MAFNPNKKVVKESKSLKRLRIFIAAMYFIEVILTTFPYLRGPNSEGVIEEFTAFGWIVQPGNFQTVEGVKLTLFCGAFLLLPLVCFFFFCLDKGNIKNFVSAACCVICVALITFFIGPAFIAVGSVWALLLYIFILFLTMICMLKTLGERQAERAENSK